MDIRDKLRQIELTQLRRGMTADVHAHPPPLFHTRLESAIDGKIKSAALGAFFCYEKNLPLDFQHGSYEIAAFQNKPSSLIAVIGQDHQLANVSLEDILFLDIEASGLSGGSGMYAFLIGIGYFTETGFRVEQFFLNNLNEERAILDELNRLVQNHQLVISYNGKSFDVPLLESRNIFHRLQTPLTRKLHLDLLHSVRRIWKYSLPDCALTTVEQQILKTSRVGDIPSYLIPQIYFTYLRDHDPHPLKPVFYHNQQDVLAMAALLSKMMQLFENPLIESESAAEIFCMARIYENLFRLEESIELYAALLTRPLGDRLRGELLLRTAFNYKKLRKWKEAEAVWQKYLETECYHPLPYIELAKYYEHRKKQFLKAKDLVEKALEEMQIIESLRGAREWAPYKQDLEHRRKRLVRKLHFPTSSSDSLAEQSADARLF